MSRGLTQHLQELASERLEQLRLLDMTSLQSTTVQPVHVRGRWWSRGTVWTDIAEVDEGVIRVAVLQTASVP
jgi:hypothetical protein